MQIELLDQHTIDKIAAGEVVENPKSIVKELLENAIDANSKSVTIEIKDGGLSYIRVTDDGCGIDASQVTKAFMRHATSKIRSEQDLNHIGTLGFRGEALSSICAVSRMEIYTKTKDELIGTHCVFEGGLMKSCLPVGTPTGTTIIVKDLFFNTPARKKFLKSAPAEGNTVYSMLEKMALSHPELMMKFVSQNQTKLQTMGNGKLAECIFDIFGKQTKDMLIELEYEQQEIKINGFAGKPEFSRGNRDTEVFFINGRYIKSKILSQALEEAYQNKLMQHKFPFCVLFLDLPKDQVDVNVHPAKMEVRFHQEKLIFDAVKKAVEQIFQKSAESSFARNTPVIREKMILETPKEKTEMIQPKAVMAPDPFEIKKKEVFFEESWKTKVTDQIREDSPYEKKYQREEPAQIQMETFLDKKVSKPRTIIGQIFRTYWLVEYDQELYFIDQHAAHERILFEKIVNRIHQKQVDGQRISPPMILTLTANQQEMLRMHSQMLEELGFEIQNFGGKEYSVSQMPYDLAGLNGKNVLEDILDGLFEERNHRKQPIVLEKIAMMSCKAAVKGNQSLHRKEIEQIIMDLLELEDPFHCPHGRPTMVRLTKSDVEKMFLRVI